MPKVPERPRFVGKLRKAVSRAGPRRVVVGAVILAAVFGFGAHSVRLAASPNFEVGLVRYFRTAILAEGVVFRQPLPGGVLEIRAARLRPGHERFWGMRLGPSTFLTFEGVEATVHRDGELYCTIRGEQAELTSELLKITEEPVLSVPGRPGLSSRTSPWRLVVVDLGSGEVRYR